MNHNMRQRRALKQAADAKPAQLASVVPDVSDLDCAFGCAMRLLPAYKDLPEEFQNGRGPYCKVAQSLFFGGGKLSDHGLRPKPGLNEAKVYRVLRACLSDFEPSHEHKIGGTGWLLSQWYDHAP